MDIARDQLYNVVIVPTSAQDAGDQRFQLSATRGDRGQHWLSPEWTESEVRAALAGAQLSPLQMHELFRGNRMAFGGKDTRFLLFQEKQLTAMGLIADPQPQPTT